MKLLLCNRRIHCVENIRYSRHRKNNKRNCCEDDYRARCDSSTQKPAAICDLCNNGVLSSVEMPCHCISKVVCKCNALFNYGNGLNVQSEHGWRVGAGSKNGAGGRRTNQLTLEA